MSELYRINLYAADAHDYDTGESGPLARMVGDGVLMPVESLASRLQAIADAWNDASMTMSGELYASLDYDFPKLVALLDALEETDNE